ncbi:DUF58 domain-containing protein [Massilia horti]|uniref:DUF58 domain-containing protein n=1 Tax=Massilia horti TaxID=2562153 RepID=A0A4Y9T7E3_9BURK|nr:DUF58 domain-containing protein [Massilia horti]TFW34471.1 DUF58 domain-containing protein [Massilia horti]
MLTGWLRRVRGQWMRRRTAGDDGEVFLSLRRVYILPTGAGIGFGALLLILLVGSVNYNLGLGFLLTFTMAACALVDIVFTYRNLAHLILRPGRALEVFAGEQAQFELHLVNRTARDRFAIRVDFADVGQTRQVADIAAGSSAALLLACPSEDRGWMAAPRVRLATRFPLGLFRAWSYWQPNCRALVYPFPEPDAPPLPLTGSGRPDGIGPGGFEDFAGVRSYQPGDHLRHLAWRQIARLDPALGGQLATKHFEGGAMDELVLDFAALAPGLDLELRLSRMARWVLEAELRALPYAFRMGGLAFGAGLGAAHRAACLHALALYPGRGKAP